MNENEVTFINGDDEAVRTQEFLIRRKYLGWHSIHFQDCDQTRIEMKRPVSQ